MRDSIGGGGAAALGRAGRLALLQQCGSGLADRVHRFAVAHDFCFVLLAALRNPAIAASKCDNL
ncbi:MAG: hypothetical protein ACE5I7_14860 [Candidatus Binatia bacterium]